VTDRRFLRANGRVAHVSLEGRVQADRFVEGEPCRVTASVCDLCRAPCGPRDKQLLRGWPFSVLERRDGWAFGFDPVDGYVGYLPETALGPPFRPTHRVVARASHVYAEPDVKAPETAALSYFSELRVTGSAGRFLALHGGGYVPAQHVAPVDRVAEDPVGIAEMFLGTPYLWGGDSAGGIDCSGLVQLALRATGRPCPRDSDQQMTLGAEVAGELARGDLLFWKGHVAMVVNAARLIHANAHHMAVVHEGTGAAIARIAAQGDGPVLARRRPARPPERATSLTPPGG